MERRHGPTRRAACRSGLRRLTRADA
jgi:hypothetical protein